jgi:hypothetical protein
MNAPVALFIYNRPEHTLMVTEALKQNILAADTDLFVFADGPKPGATAADLAKIRQARDVVSSLEGFRSVTLSFAEKNRGLAAALVEGIRTVLEKHEQIIVLEDDILTSKYFLSFCNEGLRKYEKEERVMSISGFAFPLPSKTNESYFIRLGSCWGWATWKRAWNHYSSDSAGMLREIKSKNLQHAFDLSGTHPYSQMLEQQSTGNLNSWGVCWYASVFLEDGLMLCPAKSLTVNIGTDGSGTHHTSIQQAIKVKKNFAAVERNWAYPAVVTRSEEFHKKLENYFRRQSRPAVKDKIMRAFKKIF